MAEERNLEQLKTILKNRYKANDKIERLFYPEHPLPLAGCYLDLGLVEEQVIKQVKDESRNESESRQNTETDLSGREHFLHEYERIQHIQKKLAVNTLLDECKSDKKRIYIEGAAGAGKSTLSRFIANEWANDKAPWNRYDWVFYVRLRDLTDERYTEQQAILLQVLERECFQMGHGNNLTENEKGFLNHILRTSANKILFVLDGYDELQLNTNYIRNLWEGIINSDYNFLITSRPGAQLLKNNLGINLNLAVLGFSDEQVERYVSNFFNPQHTPTVNPQDEENCLALLKNNPNLWSLAHTPIQLEMLCSSCSELKKEQDFSLTQMYRLMTENLIKRRAVIEGLSSEELDRKVLKKLYEDYLSYMEYLAFIGMQAKKIVFNQEQINQAYNILPKEKHKQTDFYRHLKAIGLVKRYNQGKQAEFAHLTFQEFFAARYVSKAIKAFSANKSHSLSTQDLLDFISKTKWDDFYEVMWWFVAGLLGGKPQKHIQTLDSYKFNKGDSETEEDELSIPKSHQRLQVLQTFFDLLLQEPREELEVLELPLLVKCLDEAGMPDIMQKEAIKKHVEIWLEFYWERDVFKTSVMKNLLNRIKSSSVLVKWMKPILIENFDNIIDDLDRPIINILSSEINNRLLHLIKHGIVRPSKAIEILSNSASEELRQEIYKLFLERLLIFITDSAIESENLATKIYGKFASEQSREACDEYFFKLLSENMDTKLDYQKIIKFYPSTGTLQSFHGGIETLFQVIPLLHKESIHDIIYSVPIGKSATKYLRAATEKILLELFRARYKHHVYLIEAFKGINAYGDKFFILTEELRKFRERLSTDLCSRVFLDLFQADPSFKVFDLLNIKVKETRWRQHLLFESTQQVINGFLLNVNKSFILLLQSIDFSLESFYKTPSYEGGKRKTFLDKILNYIDCTLNIKTNLDLLDEFATEELKKVMGKRLFELNGFLIVFFESAHGEYHSCHSGDFFSCVLESNSPDRTPGEYSTPGEQHNALREWYGIFFRQLSNVNKLGSFATERLKTLRNEILLSLLNLEKYNLMLHQDAVRLYDFTFRDTLEFLKCDMSELTEEIKQALLLIMQKIKIDNLSYFLKGIAREFHLPLVTEILIKFLSKTKVGLILLRDELFKPRPLLIPPSRLITSFEDIVKVNAKGELDCLKLCGTVLLNIFSDGNSHNLTESTWTLAIVRKKTNRDQSSSSFFNSVKKLIIHSFLILEGVKDNVRFVKKIDFYAEAANGSLSKGQRVKIEITDIDNFKRLEELANNSVCMVSGLSKEKAEKLLKNIETDQERADRGEIVYNLTGDGSSKQQHSCISWCIEKWIDTGLSLKRKWYDAIIVLPTAYLPDTKKEKSESSESKESTKCLVM